MNRSSSTTHSSTSLLVLAAAFAAIFLVTALVGVWAAYDRDAAWHRFALITLGVVAALAIALLGQFGGERFLALGGMACAWAAAAVAVYFLIAYDWQDFGAAKAGFGPVYQVGLWIQAHRPTLPVPEQIHANVAGGALALLTPLGAGAAGWSLHRQRFRLLAWISIPAVLLATGALVLTMSRGALLGVAAGLGIALYLTWRQRWQAQRWRRVGDAAMVALGIVGVVGLGLLLTRFTSVDSSTASRPQMWRWAIDLIADYPFTGSGLGSTMMVHATYLLIIHVGFIPHMHDLFLQTGVEQGIPGMAAFLALLLLAITNVAVAYHRRGSLWLIGGAIVALSVLVVQGVFDSVPYASRLVSATFVPLGFALGLPGRLSPTRASFAASHRFSPVNVVTVTALLVSVAMVLLLFSRPGRAALQSNLGAVAQTRAELHPYTWPEWPIQDALRRSPEIDLGPAIARYQAALAIDPRQASANRRLGQIEMSQGTYDAARKHLETSYQESPRRQATRYLLGESYAIEGQINQAVDLWRTTSSQLWWEEDWLSRAVLQGREYWYTSIDEPLRAETLRQARAQVDALSAP